MLFDPEIESAFFLSKATIERGLREVSATGFTEIALNVPGIGGSIELSGPDDRVSGGVLGCGFWTFGAHELNKKQPLSQLNLKLTDSNPQASGAVLK